MHKRYSEGIYQSKWVSKFINQCGFVGKQQMSEYIISSVFFLFKKKLRIAPLFFFFEVIEKIKPIVGLKLYKKQRKKINGVIALPYLLDIPLRYKKAIFWLSRAIKLRVGSTFFVKIFQEFYDILFLNSGLSYKKKKEYYGYSMLYKKVHKFKW